MSQPLTYTSIFATLVTLGAVACGGATPAAESPVEAKEVPAATASESAPAAAASEANAAAPAAPASDTAAAPAAPATDGAPAPAAAADASKPADAKTAPAAMHKKKAAGAKAGCGAGTCG